MQGCSALDSNGKGFTVSRHQNRSYIAKRQGKGDPDHQAVKRQQSDQDKERHCYITSYEQKSMEALAKCLTEKHGQRSLMNRQVVMVIARLVHMEDGAHYKTH